MRYLPALDGLRALAVLAVVAYHAGLGGAGFVGVDVFFVISGYLITGLLAREHAETGRIDFLAFYARRVRRILPAMACVVVVTLLLGLWLLPSTKQHALAQSAVAAMAMVGNVFFQGVTGGYFDSAADEMPLLHLWSLGVEEQFYLLWPLLLAGLLRWRKAVPVAGLLAVASLGTAQYLLATNPEAAFYQMPARFWELAIGGVIALRPATGRASVAYAGLVLLGFAIAVPMPAEMFPGVGALPAVLGAAMVIHALHGGVNVPLLRSRPMVFVGLISYSLYLWHWPLLALARAVSLTPPSVPASLALCTLAGVLAWLSYRFVETPFRRLRAPRPRIVATGLMASACVMLAAGAFSAQTAAATGMAARVLADRSDTACHVGLPQLFPVPASCRPAKADVVLWGDSHALSWLPFARSLGTVSEFTMDACAPALGWGVDHRNSPKHRGACDAYNRQAVAYIGNGARTVIIAESLKGDHMAALAGIGRSVAAVAPHAGRVLLMAPVPYLKKPAMDCIEYRMECGMTRAEFDAYAAPRVAALRAIASRYENVEVIDSASFFCTATACPMLRDGSPLYWDDNHITRSAAVAFAKYYRRDLSAILLDQDLVHP